MSLLLNLIRKNFSLSAVYHHRIISFVKQTTSVFLLFALLKK